jgi:hypothetical protein
VSIYAPSDCLPSPTTGSYLLWPSTPQPGTVRNCVSHLISSLISRISRIESVNLPIPDTTDSNMSFNLTSDGSPTPRKAVSRFAVPNDLRLDTSPEVLGFGPVGTRTRRHPSQYVWPGSALLTSNMQGAKRPLGSSTLGNQMMPPQPNIDTFKVSPSPQPQAPCLAPFLHTLLLGLDADHSGRSRSSKEIMKSPPLSILCSNASMSSGLLLTTSMDPPTVLFH